MKECVICVAIGVMLVLALHQLYLLIGDIRDDRRRMRRRAQ